MTMAVATNALAQEVQDIRAQSTNPVGRVYGGKPKNMLLNGT